MVRGFYQLGSGVLTYNRVLGNISNNLANVKTPGYKREQTLTSTFEEMLLNRIDGEQTPIGTSGMIRRVDETIAIHTAGAMGPTDRELDVALPNSGFFAVQSENGTVYTRKGSFDIDEEGYLSLSGVGRVLGTNGPIAVRTDAITIGAQGEIYDDAAYAGQLAVYDFADYATLTPVPGGCYTAAGGANLVDAPVVLSKTLEGSNVDTAEEMTNAISAQRGLQSCTQILKMYDQILAKAVADIGRI